MSSQEYMPGIPVPRCSTPRAASIEMTPSSSRPPLPNGFAPLSLLVALSVMLASPSQAFVLQLPAAAISTGPGRTISSCSSIRSGTTCFRRTQWVYDQFGSSTSTAAAARQGAAAAGVSGEFCALGGRRGQRAPTVTSMTASSHHHHQRRSSAPIMRATAGEASSSPATATGALANQGIPRKLRRRPMIGAAVWAAFKEEQKGVTRALHGLPEEAGSNARTDATAALGTDEGAPRQLPRPTLGAFMAETRSRSPDMESMVPIMKAVGKTCTAVSRLVRRAQIDGMAGLHQEGSAATGGGGGEAAAESVNVQGEAQKELDVLSNSIFLTGLCQPRSMSCVASEEEEAPRMCAAVVGEHKHGGEYAAVFDPLDGSANIEAGLPCGTIFGILRTSGSTREGRKAGPGTIVLPGRRLVAAGYCLYGPSTKLVFTLGNGVFEFTLEGEGAAEQQEAGWRLEAGNSGSGSGSGGGGGGSGSGLGGGNLNFVLSKSNMRIPQSGKVYSVNEANSPSWSGAIQDYFRDLKTSMANDDDGDDDEEEPSSQGARGGGDVENQYAGALVADIHNILVNGGVFAYPADVHNPNGKLRLLYEGNPMAMIIEEAGGVATTGFERIMDVRPQSVHHRIPAFFGSPENLLPLLNPRYLDSKRKR